MLLYRPFHSCVLTYLAHEYKRGWRGPLRFSYLTILSKHIGVLNGRALCTTFGVINLNVTRDILDKQIDGRARIDLKKIKTLLWLKIV